MDDYAKGSQYAERCFEREGLAGLIDAARMIGNDTTANPAFAAGVVDAALIATTLAVETEVA